MIEVRSIGRPADQIEYVVIRHTGDGCHLPVGQQQLFIQAAHEVSERGAQATLLDVAAGQDDSMSELRLVFEWDPGLPERAA